MIVRLCCRLSLIGLDCFSGSLTDYFWLEFCLNLLAARDAQAIKARNDLLANRFFFLSQLLVYIVNIQILILKGFTDKLRLFLVRIFTRLVFQLGRRGNWSLERPKNS